MHDRGASNQPTLGLDNNGNVHIVWYSWVGGEYYVKMYYTKLDNNGNTLIENIDFVLQNFAGFYPSLTVDSNGNVHVAWIIFSQGIYYTMLDNNGRKLVPETNIFYGTAPDIKADDSGNIHLSFHASEDAFYLRGRVLDNNTNPSVTVDIPNGGEGWTGMKDILWTAGDIEQTGADELSATLYHGPSPNGPWTQIAADLPCTSGVQASYSYNTTLIPNGATWIQVVVSDGFGGTASDASDASFTVLNCFDADNDNYYSYGGCGTTADCNDSNPNINPGTNEICDDGLDNDCDGNIDINDSDCIVCLPDETRSCNTGLLGVCAVGIQVCNVTGSWSGCMQTNQPSDEVCDGADNDCDGLVDDNLTRVCGTDVGECQIGIQTCSYGSWGSCVGEVGPSQETCDSLDNDCDGNIDDGFDLDSDGVADCVDNCPSDYNPDQLDCDGDGKGNICDSQSPCSEDPDGDGIPDSVDNCPVTPNPDQADTDGDGVGDVCDICPLAAGCDFPNVISYWKFDENEGAIVYDVTSNENDGAINGASWTSGKIAGALSFDGNDDFVNCGKDTTLDLGTGDLSICTWVKTSGSGIQMIMNKRSVNPEYPGYQLSTGSSGEVRLGLFDGSQAYPNNFKEIASVIKINDGQWHFICGVADRFSNGYVYVDGQPNGSDNITNYSGSLDAPDANLYIGANQTGDNLFRGVIDEVIIYNKALSASEVLDRFITEGGTVDTAPPVFSGLESAIDNEDGETIDLSWGVASDPSKPITYKIYYATEPGQQDFTTPHSVTKNTSYRITGLTKDQIYYIVVRAEDAFGNKESNTIELSVTPTRPCANPPCPVGYWKFDKGSGSTAIDETANNNDGTIIQASWVTGKYGNALSFDGNRDFVSVESRPSLRITSNITVAAWFKISSNRSYQMIVSKTDGGGYQLGYDNESLYDNKLAFMVYTNGRYQHTGIGVSEIAVNTWYHVVGTYDGSRIKLYLNGIERASRSVTGNIKDTPDTCVFIGEEPSLCYPYDWSFGGVIDEVVIFDQALSALEVHDLYNNGATQ
jgi:hypothetical protein